MCCGLGDGTAVTTAVANPVTTPTGETLWNFVNQSTTYTPTLFVQKYETPLLIAGAFLVGTLLFFGMRK